MHDIGEQYLFFVHMSQHLLLTLVMPPLFLLATPGWLARLVLGSGSGPTGGCAQLALPVVGRRLSTTRWSLFTHWPARGERRGRSTRWVHYGLHAARRHAAPSCMWMPVCGPIEEWRISLPAQMVYLFVIRSWSRPCPGAWLTFADEPVYRVYDTPHRLCGISRDVDDQQAAGLIMKLAGGSYLWVIITGIFFVWAARHADAETRGEAPTEREVLTWDKVQREFERTPAPVER